MTTRGPLLLLDAASLYYRAFFGDRGKILAPDGSPVGAVRGFLDMIAYLVRERRPSGLVACWDDDWRPEFRVAALPSYKAHRVAADGGEDAPPELGPQVDLIVEVLAALGIARVGAAGCEADDVIGTLTTRALAADATTTVEIATGDRDLFQLVSPRVRVLYTARGVRNLDVIDEPRLAERYGVASGDAYADLAVLRGDASDGLPGVAGIGEKTGAGLLGRFGTLAGVVAAADDPGSDLSAGQRAKLLAGAEYLAVAPGVVRVLRDADLPEADPELPGEPRDAAALAALSSRWGLGSSVTRLRAALTAG
ncbi:5'-3' exonuclease [Salana multivorans]|uniref:5'-3' exonuclease n=1 Tax=Salana multivorans TaxID=120377 RepID=A0A3N2DBS1_9MICO|nr:5'-3' exonuclease [Salana multivorans]ROR97142.1 5'-3' exonuclease [Salana multivorans]